MFSKKMINNFIIHLYLNIKSPMKKETTTIADIKVKACDILRTAYGQAFLDNIIQNIRRSLNVPFKCPIKEVS